VIEELFSKPILIFGCGNVLFGDDGFGPEVIEHLHAHHSLPPSASAFDVGTSISDLLFDLLLSPRRPSDIFIVDAVSAPNRRPGELFEMDIRDLPAAKSVDFSLHQFPSVNLLQELRDFAGIRVKILAVQAAQIPDAVRPGLSPQVRAAVPGACAWLVSQASRAGGDRAGNLPSAAPDPSETFSAARRDAAFHLKEETQTP
jgi:coenzyme F420 hydrogenase subunit delta